MTIALNNIQLIEYCIALFKKTYYLLFHPINILIVLVHYKTKTIFLIYRLNCGFDYFSWQV